MVYHCATELVADNVAGTEGLLTAGSAPTRTTWMTGATGYAFSNLGPAAQAFVERRNLLEGNAAQCCRCAPSHAPPRRDRCQFDLCHRQDLICT